MVLSKMLVVQNAIVEAIVCAKSGQRMKAVNMMCIGTVRCNAHALSCWSSNRRAPKKTAVVLQKKIVVRIIVYRKL